MSYIHELSEDDVRQAPIFASSRPPRINIDLEKPNIILFKLSFDQGRYATVEFHIKPFYHGSIQHILFHVEGHYTPSHGDISVEQVTDAAQLIYDTYINVIKLKLNGNTLKREDSSEETRRDIKTSKNRPRNDPQALAENLVITIKKAQEDLVKRKEAEPRLEANYDHAVFQGLIPNDGKIIDLNQIEQALKDMQNYYKDDKRKLWTSWYFRCCFQMVIEKAYNPPGFQGHNKNKPFQGAKIVNLIINKLLISDGLAAMGVYIALIESGNRLSKPAELKPKDVECFVDLVAKGLHGQIYAPSPASLIPFSGLWLGALFYTVQYTKICEIIGLPQLACLVGRVSLSSRALLTMGVEMSVLTEDWTATSSWTLMEGVI
ncbi:hypothetical protein V8C35DRAFT_307547, partial [Trichoderma chlorosporum]